MIYAFGFNATPSRLLISLDMGDPSLTPEASPLPLEMAAILFTDVASLYGQSASSSNPLTENG